MSDSAESIVQRDEVTVQTLEYAATNTTLDEFDTYALAIALREGQIDGEEAAEAVQVLHEDRNQFFQEHYPGDDCYDRADREYGGLY